MTELLGLPYSPWTEKARFALDVRKVKYRFVHYQPLIGEPLLRVKLRRARGNVSVPVLTTVEGKAIADSAEIARWADGQGEGPELFPRGLEAKVDELVALSERALAAGRALSLTRVLADDEALRELVPKNLRGPLGPLAAKVSALGVARTRRKYGGNLKDLDAHRRDAVAVLDDVRARLEASGGRTLLGRFTFADIAVAQAMVFIEPPASGLRLGEANRRNFRDVELREAYADLVAWRDALYAEYRSA